jgi:hypothetical protein
VALRNGLPTALGGKAISFIIDHYRVCPNWWEGYNPRDYYLVDVLGRTVCIYQAGEQWFLDSVVD